MSISACNVLDFFSLLSGTASVARGFSQYVDALANDSIENAFYDAMPLVPEEEYTTSFLSPYPDF